MVTPGDPGAATAGLEDDLRLSFAPGVLGKVPHRRVMPAERAGDPCPGFDGDVSGMPVDPGETAGSEGLMAELAERKEPLEGCCERMAGQQPTVGSKGFDSFIGKEAREPHRGERRLSGSGESTLARLAKLRWRIW